MNLPKLPWTIKNFRFRDNFFENLHENTFFMPHLSSNPCFCTDLDRSSDSWSWVFHHIGLLPPNLWLMQFLSLSSLVETSAFVKNNDSQAINGRGEPIQMINDNWWLIISGFPPLGPIRLPLRPGSGLRLIQGRLRSRQVWYGARIRDCVAGTATAKQNNNCEKAGFPPSREWQFGVTGN